MGKILAINYSQTGQLNQILDNFLEPLGAHEIDQVKVWPQKRYPFPWTSDVFFDAMPETVLEEKIELEPFEIPRKKYDLIILGYQPWFLSPSPPATALLQDPALTSVMQDTPVITVIGARNMWLNAQESVKKYIREAGGILVGNVPLIDRNPNLISAVTILYWMLTGKKDRFLNLFPFPGVSNEDIEETSIFGEIVNEDLEAGDFDHTQDKVLDTGRIGIQTNILFIELRAKKLFRIWAGIIKPKKGRARALWVSIYKYYLLIALFIVAPIILTIYNILILPFTLRSVNKTKAKFLRVER